MLQIFSRSCIGYSHIKNKKPCQDYSSQYKDNNKAIVTCCDGHGGDIYIRSNRGSEIASCSIINVLSSIKSINYRKYTVQNFIDKIRLEILCEWNKLVEKDLAAHPISKYEVEGLDEDKQRLLKINPIKAYGTTLAGAMVLGDKLIVVSIGDTEVIGISKGQIIKLFDYDDDPAANLTYSMCQEDAYEYLRVNIYDFSSYDGIILCTDGMSSPYQSYDNFNESFVKPVVKRIINKENLSYIDNFVEDMASQYGNGDDVSLSFVIKDKVFKKYYN